MPLLRRDIPKWLEWLEEEACQEWQAFLRDPLPPGTREHKLPQLVEMRKAEDHHHSVERCSILSRPTFSEVGATLRENLMP